MITKSCYTCRYYELYDDEEPCISCRNYHKWTAKPEPLPDEKTDPDGPPIPEDCRTCEFRDYDLDQEPCKVCDDHERWKRDPVLRDPSPHIWTKLKAIKDRRVGRQEGVKDPVEIDSKIAAGSKKSAPFLLALPEMYKTAHEIRQDPAFGVGSAENDLFEAWMERRAGIDIGGGLPLLPLLAVNAFECLALDIGLAKPWDGWCQIMAELWRVSQFGEPKHGANNWMSAQADGMWHYEAAMWRHWIERKQGELRAEDSQCYHSAHMAWNALMLLEMSLRGVVNPDWKDLQNVLQT